ncbi:DUF3710 domain-containing protein [Bifidobacterium psychraerophilum]|jgi:hypothetical protein|uniref:DUF3710 domain-containing protein n=1 Tax=Bifidobacterium psychraerophilum TaxID=218140 RepID=UPI0023F3A6AE|nr:DUF3710 domain-containing protein [Bifidobacterium psychraerophilum]MCI1660760.1 DUF3710 domain-containing protein [Bifidobacterium psychraerophilum]MCI1804199.1 DUF3710 domain-containing protein [Bifidobacterium psychraerophilum]MCI2176646.1 DUF3710 domain-containing protein [Bifidobacterium psychraerophilum]MCI2181543.1 DUF3710 domain-containing protein [Bifidobacterium psychraerophilum]
MGLFGFGKQRSKRDETNDEAPIEEAEDKDLDAAEIEDTEDLDEQVADEAADDEDAKPVVDFVEDDEDDEESAYQGTTYEGPWDAEDDDVIDYGSHLDVGAFHLPYLQGVELRLKANRSTGQILGATITYGSSSLELEAFAAPKTMGLWDEVRTDLINANPESTEEQGAFGTEILLPVSVKGKRLMTRVVGVDGPRWMLRGIFSGNAAAASEEKDILDQYFSDIVVERGDEPLAPHDLIPMHPPVAPDEDADDEQEDGAQDSDDKDAKIPGKPKGPFNSDQQTEVKSTLSRGPMFSEMR